MPRCNDCSQTCSCVIVAGEGISTSGAGTAANPLVITAEGGGGGGGWDPGDLKEVAHGDTPAGWLECLGQAVNRAAFPALFAAIGTTYGIGDGSTTFNVPNYAGRSRVGAGSGYVLGTAGGTDQTTLSVVNLPAHSHVTYAHVHRMANHTHGMSHDHGVTTTESVVHSHVVRYAFADNTETKASGGARRITQVGSGSESAATGQESTAHQHTVVPFGGNTDGPLPANTDAAPDVLTSSTGSGVAFSNLPPYRVVRVLIHT